MARECIMSQSPNRLLASLSQNIFAAMEPHLRLVKLAFGDVISDTDQPINHVYFPFSGVVSLVVDLSVGEMIETAMVGRDGVVNGTSALDGRTSLHRGIVQVAGEATTIHSEALRKLATEFEPLHSILIRHEQVLLAQAQQSAGCNASHTVEERMCRWLLRIALRMSSGSRRRSSPPRVSKSKACRKGCYRTAGSAASRRKVGPPHRRPPL